MQNLLLIRKTIFVRMDNIILENIFQMKFNMLRDHFFNQFLYLIQKAFLLFLKFLFFLKKGVKRK